jgi:nitrite reductase/ring-hydroxylating ferredoxin subunit
MAVERGGAGRQSQTRGCHLAGASRMPTCVVAPGRLSPGPAPPLLSCPPSRLLFSTACCPCPMPPLQEDAIPFELFGQAWVLFRGADGRPACILDECAHRACPLSIGTVVDGCLQCPYHGWRYNGKGECTKMPSTTLCRGVAGEHGVVGHSMGANRARHRQSAQRTAAVLAGMAAVVQLRGSDVWKCVFVSVVERRCIKQGLGKEQEQLLVSDVHALRPSATPPAAVTVACPPALPIPSLPVCDSLQPLRSERIALRGAGRLCVGVARVGRAATAAAHLHTAAARLPHPRRWGLPGGRAIALTMPCCAVLCTTSCCARMFSLLLSPRVQYSTPSSRTALSLSSISCSFPAEIEVEVPVEHGLLVENLLDLAHAPFTHTSTFARGWPVRCGSAPCRLLCRQQSCWR